MYLFSTHNEEWAWGKGELRSLNDQGDRRVAHIVATNRECAQKTRPEKARAVWRDRHTSVEAPDVCCLPPPGRNGVYTTGRSARWRTSFIGHSIARRGPCRRASLFRPLSTSGRYPPDLPNVSPASPIGRILDCRRRCSRAAVPFFPHGALLSTKSKGVLAAPCATQSAGSPALRLHHSESRIPAAYKLPCPGLCRPTAVSLAILASRLLRFTSRLSAASSASSFASITL